MDNAHHHNGYWKNASSWQLPAAFLIRCTHNFLFHPVVRFLIFFFFFLLYTAWRLSPVFRRIWEADSPSCFVFHSLYRVWILIVEMWCNDRLIDLSWAAVVDGTLLKTPKRKFCNVQSYRSGGICRKSDRQTEADLNTQPTTHQNMKTNTQIYIWVECFGFVQVCVGITCIHEHAIPHWCNVLHLKTQSCRQ